MDDRTADTTLAAIAQFVGLSFGTVRGLTDEGEEVVIISARDGRDDAYRVTAPTYSAAVVALAELVGFDLMDG